MQIRNCFSFSIVKFMNNEHYSKIYIFPLGPTLANIFMSYTKLKFIPDFKNKLFYLTYLDDGFLLVRNEKIVDELFNISNNAHNFMSFTMVKENIMNLLF